MIVTYLHVLKEFTNEIQLLFVMVLTSEEVSWSSVSSEEVECENKGNEDGCGRNPFGYVKDRSLSYLDIPVREQLSCGKNSKVFESVRRFGKPRQQKSDDLVDLADPYFSGGKERSGFGDSFYFGERCILPKVSTLPPKGNLSGCAKYNERRRYVSPGRRKPEEGSENYVKKPEGMFSDQHVYEFENKMYRWNETLSSENQQRRVSRRSSVEDAGRQSLGRPESRKEFLDHHREEDIEAQVNTNRRRDTSRGPDSRDDYFFYNYDENTLERRGRRRKDVDEVSNPVSDIRENWKLRVMRENEVKELRQTLEKRRKDAKDDGWGDGRSIKEGKEIKDKKELHRSKSTPDMLEGIGKGILEIWNFQEGPKRNGSMMEVYPDGWAVHNDQQEADSLNDPNSLQEPVSSPEPPGGGKSRNSRFPSGKNFFGHFLASRGNTPTDMFDNTEPFSQFWVILSNIYGQALVIVMFAFCLTEVMDNSVKLLSLQGIFLMYLYVGSIAVIICIYIWVLIDSCSSMSTNDATGLVPPTITTSIVHDREADLHNLSTTKFGSLKKAHISRDRTSNTSFYLRIGAIAFGLGTLVFNGLEMAMHSMMENSCLNNVVFVHPILHGLFTFLQMHFLFVNSQVLVERFGLAARFGFMHLAATNLALWIRLIIWESGNEWTYYVHLSRQGFGHTSTDIPSPLQLRGFPKFIQRSERAVYSGIGEVGLYQAISNDHLAQVVSLHQCLNTNSLGQLWTSSMPFLYPFIIQFSLIAAAVTYIMGLNVAKDRLFFQKQKKAGASDGKGNTLPRLQDALNSWGVDCRGASKGLFLGILCLVTGVVVIIIFLVVKENEDFPPETIFWLTTGTLITILSITVTMNIVGLVQIRKLSVIGTKMSPLDKILSIVSMIGVQLYTILGIVVGASGVAEEFGGEDYLSTPLQKRHGMLLAVSIIQLVQAIMQNSFIVEGLKRTSLSRSQVLGKPARQVVTFLMFTNAVLWAFDSFVVQSWTSQELQLRFFGVLAWGVVSRIGLPLLVFFRFHSCVLLLEIWKKSYHSLHIDPGN